MTRSMTSLCFCEDREEPGVIFRLSLQVLQGGRRCVAEAFATEAATKLSAGRPANRDVELRDTDLQAQRLRNPQSPDRCRQREHFPLRQCP